MLVLAGVYFWATAQIPSLELGDPLGPKAFPRMLGVGLLVAAAMLLAEILRDRKKAKSASQEAWKWDPQQWLVIAVAAWTAAYISVFEFLGFMIATTIYLLGLTGFFNKGRWLMNVLTSVLFSVIGYFAFTKLLGVSLARGLLPF
jgi:putative tricarboxylic transport membrane protein